MTRALLVGGTGPTGPHIVEGLAARGFDVTIFHRGTHEVEFGCPVVHIHGDPHFAPSIAEALDGRSFDVVVAAYGRLRLLAEQMAGHCGRFIGIGGVAVYPGHHEPAGVWPHGLRPAMREQDLPSTRPDPDDSASAATRFSAAVFRTERHVLDLHDAGRFSASYFRYPVIYGPRQLGGKEWSVVRRIRDGRRRLIVPDGGLAIMTRAHAANAAHAVLLAVDHPDASAGQVYNVGDEQQFTLRQWAEVIASELDAPLELVSVPDHVAWPARALFPLCRESAHSQIDTAKIGAELGYRDVVPADAALRETARWYWHHQDTADELAGTDDAFDYAGEDQLLALFDGFLETYDERYARAAPPSVHPYPHPVAPGLTRDHRGR